VLQTNAVHTAMRSASGLCDLSTLIGMRGVARRTAQIECVHLRCRRWRAPSGAPHAAISNTGPRFPLPTLAGRSASSWQGPVVAPGGAPMPPECRTAIRPAGAATRPAAATPRDDALKRTSWGHGTPGLEGGDKMADSLPLKRGGLGWGSESGRRNSQ
jgi:hypothetical protein